MERTHTRERMQRERVSSEDRYQPIDEEILIQERRRVLSEKLGYNDEDNPFKDSKLSSPFIWKRKIESQHTRPVVTAASLLEQTNRKLCEIQNVKLRREQRERDEKLLEEERAKRARERELQNYVEWQKCEADFLAGTVRLRTTLRVKEGRETLGDLLVKEFRISIGGEEFTDLAILRDNVSVVFEAVDGETLKSALRLIRARKNAEAQEERMLRGKLSAAEAEGDSEAVIKAIKKELSNIEEGKPYWSAVMVLGERRQRELTEGVSAGVTAQVKGRLEGLMRNKTIKELEDLEAQIRKLLGQSLSNADLDVDVDIEFWEEVLQQVPYYKALSLTDSVHRRATAMVEAALKRKERGSIEESSEGRRHQFRSTKDRLMLFSESESTESAHHGRVSSDATIEGENSVSPILYPFEEGNTTHSNLLTVKPEDEFLMPQAAQDDRIATNTPRSATNNPSHDVTESVVPPTGAARVLMEAEARLFKRKRRRGDSRVQFLPDRPVSSDELLRDLSYLPQIGELSKRNIAEKIATMQIQREGGGDGVDHEREGSTGTVGASLESSGPGRGITFEREDSQSDAVQTFDRFIQQEANIVRPEDADFTFNAVDEISLKELRALEQSGSGMLLGGRYETSGGEKSSGGGALGTGEYTSGGGEVRGQQQQQRSSSMLLPLVKPRYFNRVRTGFEWNSYNQNHYDQENPPPRMVQGYKFNIFYPELIAEGRTPTWRLMRSVDDDSTLILKFSAGPPYEDVAFRILRREWDTNPKRGFKNQFDRGILQLHFNLKRLRYRK